MSLRVYLCFFFLLYPFIPQRLWVFAERARCCFCCVIRRSEAEQMKPKRSVWEPVWIRLQSWSGFIILTEYWGWRSNCSAWHGFNGFKCTENPDIIWFWCGVADYVLWSFRQKNPHNFIRIICCRDWGASLRILGGIRLNSAELHFTHFSRANRGEMWLWACEYESQASTLLSRFCELRV